MVSGAAALVKQLHPNWPAQDIKSALVNTTAMTPIWDGQPARVMEGGNGRLDLAQALHASISLNPVSLNFGFLSDDLLDSASDRASFLSGSRALTGRPLEVTNLGPTFDSFELEILPLIENPSVEIFVSRSSLALSPGEKGVITVSIEFLPPLTGGTFEGHLQLLGADPDSVELNVPYWGALTVEDTSVLLRVAQQGEADYRSLTEALQAAQPGNIVEITDNKTYREVLNIDYNRDGLLLSGITLRGKPGQSPLIDAGGLTPASPTVSVSNLKGVTIEGLKIQGGSGGIWFYRSTGIIRNNWIAESRQGPNSHGIQLVESRVHIYQNAIEENDRSGIASFSSQALIQKNKISGNGEHGILGSTGSRVALFDNQIVQNGKTSGQGIRLLGADALIKGNSILGTQGPRGDGILAQTTPSLIFLQDNLIKHNEGKGVSLVGAEAFLSRSRIEENMASGIALKDDSRATVVSTLLKTNGTGVELSSSTLEMLNTLVTTSTSSSGGDGIFSQEASLNLHNSTLYGNRGYGIQLENSVALVANSILFQNSQGDLSGTSNFSLRNNLIGDGQFDQQQDNFADDPRFRDPTAADFSLRWNSPAIDRGSHKVPILNGDLFSHDRIVDGLGDGVPQVDLGAIEFASEYSPGLILPILSTQNSQFVGPAVTNASSQPSRVEMRAYDLKGGEPFGTFAREVAAESQLSILLVEAFGTLRRGWVEILSTAPDLVSFTLLGHQDLTFLDGADLSFAQSRKILFPEIHHSRDQRTWLYLVNPHPDPLNVTLSWIGPRRTITQVYVIPGKGMLETTSIDDLLLTEGYVTAEAEKVIYGMELFGGAQSRAGLLGLDYEEPSAELFCAHLASTSSLETILNLINAGPQIDLTLEAFDEKGQLFKSTLVEALPTGAQYRKRPERSLVFPRTPSSVG